MQEEHPSVPDYFHPTLSYFHYFGAGTKTVVAVRMRRAGARYSQHGGQAILIFRTAILSHRFPQLASLLGRSYTAKVEVRKAA
jgi:hypothetical protein